MVSVNGGPAWEDADGLPFNAELPLQPWVCDGTNRLRIDLVPVPGAADFDSDTEVSAILYVREWGADRSTRIEVTRLTWPPLPGSAEPGQPSVPFAESPAFHEYVKPQGNHQDEDGSSPGGIQHPRTRISVWRDFVAHVPFPRWRWFDAPHAEDAPETIDELWKELESFHHLLIARDVDAIVKALEWRNTELAACQYQSMSKRLADCRAEYVDMVEDRDLKPAQPTREESVLRLFAGGRLARIDAWHGRSPLYYVQKQNAYAVYLPLMFCRDGRGGWKIIR